MRGGGSARKAKSLVIRLVDDSRLASRAEKRLPVDEGSFGDGKGGDGRPDDPRYPPVP